MRYGTWRHMGVLAATAGLCGSLLTACENTAEPNQLTVVQGTVTSADNGRPLAGALLGIGSFQRAVFYRPYPQPTADSVCTDAQGKYQLSFRNAKGLYYAVMLEPDNAAYNSTRRFTFATGQPADPLLGYFNWEVKVGRANTVDFKPNELRTVAVRIRNRNTGYQRLYLDYRWLRGDNLDTLVVLRSFYLPAAGATFRYYKAGAPGAATTKDTLVALVGQNSASLAPDTVRATLTFKR